MLHLPKLARNGFWRMLHEARAEFDMLLGLIYLLIEGAGVWSLDAMLSRKHTERSAHEMISGYGARANTSSPCGGNSRERDISWNRC